MAKLFSEKPDKEIQDSIRHVTDMFSDRSIDDATLTLLGPCGEHEVHQFRYKILSRIGSQDCDALLTTIDNNPNSISTRLVTPDEIDYCTRRDVIQIDFWCEHCAKPGPSQLNEYGDEIHDAFVHTLEIRQHKGMTLMRWIK